MGEMSYPSEHNCRISAKCFNLVHLARVGAEGYLQMGLPGMSDNMILLSASHWRCWNRQLDTQLISWRGFKRGKRNGLHEPVECTLTLHHAYSRTVIHRIYESLIEASERRLRYSQGESTGSLLFLDVEQGRASIYKSL